MLLEDVGGRWTVLGRIAGFSDINGSFVIARDGSVWISHWIKGVYRLHLDLHRRRFDVVDFYDSSRGLPSNENTSVAMHGGEPVIACSAGYYRLDGKDGHMVAHMGLNAYFRAQVSPHLYHSPEGDI